MHSRERLAQSSGPVTPVTADDLGRLRGLVHALSNDLALILGALDLVAADSGESVSPFLQATLRDAQHRSTRAQGALGEIGAILRERG